MQSSQVWQLRVHSFPLNVQDPLPRVRFSLLTRPSMWTAQGKTGPNGVARPLAQRHTQTERSTCWGLLSNPTYPMVHAELHLAGFRVLLSYFLKETRVKKWPDNQTSEGICNPSMPSGLACLQCPERFKHPVSRFPYLKNSGTFTEMGRTWATAKRGSYESLYLLNSGHFSRKEEIQS